MSTKLTAARNLFELLRPLAPRRTAPRAASQAPGAADSRTPDTLPGADARAPRRPGCLHRDESPRTARVKMA